MNNERYRRKGWIICDNKGYPFGLVCLRSVFESECFGTCEVVEPGFDKYHLILTRVFTLFKPPSAQSEASRLEI